MRARRIDPGRRPPWRRLLEEVEQVRAENRRLIATFKQGFSLGDEAAVRTLVEAGFLVVSNVDSADGSPLENAARRDAALAAGVHHASSDFPAPAEEGGYSLTLPGGAPARCNPVSAPVGCTAADIEALP